MLPSETPTADLESPPLSLEPAETSTGQRLDERWIGLTRLVNAISCAVLGLIMAASGIALWITLPTIWKSLVILVWLLAIAGSVVSIVWWPRWQYQRWSYQVGEHVLELRFGLIWHVTVAIPLSRLQHIDVHRGPLERRSGLASIQFHTAGTRNASHTIPGLDHSSANALRDQLIFAAGQRADASDDE